MRRLPVFVLVDVSESMAGGALTAMHNGMELLLQSLKKDPQVLEIGAMSVISFGAEANVETPLESVLDVRIPSLDLSSGTSLGAAFDLLTREIGTRVTKTTYEVRGDYKPVIFLITDGQPTDDWRKGLTKFRKCYPTLPVHAIGCGDDVDFSILKEITPNTYMLRDMSADSFGKLFQCVTASVRSVTASMMNGDALKDDLMEWTDGTVERPAESDCCPKGGSRQVLIPAQCSATKRHYLLRYKKDEIGGFSFAAAHPLEKKLEGTGANGSNVNVSQLDSSGMKCPYCGNTEAFYCHTCNMLVCLKAGSKRAHCPGCGFEGEISFANFDLRQSLG